MTTAKIALLDDRGVIAVTGEDAGKFLQGLITNDMDLVDGESAIFAGLLSPQGKILFDFFVVRAGDGFLLDVAKEQAGELVKRLTMYKLRTKVAIADQSNSMAVVAGLGATLGGRAVSFDDPRRAGLWPRAILLDAAAFGGPALIASNRGWGTGADYNANRIALGIPEGGHDYAFGEAFPHEALFDQLGGVSFTKGCYVGQEIVARMEHRGTARKRIVRVRGAGELPRMGTEVKAGYVVIGHLGSHAGKAGLAMLRLDRVIEFAGKGVVLTAGNVEIAPDEGDVALLAPKSQAADP